MPTPSSMKCTKSSCMVLPEGLVCTDMMHRYSRGCYAFPFPYECMILCMCVAMSGIYVCACTRAPVYMYACACVHVCLFVCMYVCMCITCMCIYMCMCMYIIHINQCVCQQYETLLLFFAFIVPCQFCWDNLTVLPNYLKYNRQINKYRVREQCCFRISYMGKF